MNWLDIVILVIIFLCLILGARIGLARAFGPTLGLIIGSLLAGQLSDDVGALFGKSLSTNTLVTVISYVIIIAVTLIVISVVWRALQPMLFTGSVNPTPKADKVGGMVLGLIGGLALSGALIVFMARLAYNFEAPTVGLAGRIVGQIPRVEHTRGAVEGSLISSALVPVFIDLADALPGNALGFVPSNFKVSLDNLEQSIESDSSS